MTVVEATL